MALQIPPMAFLALKYGAVAAAGFTAARLAPRGRFPQAVEAEMDATPNGLRFRKAHGQLSAAGRITRDWRAGRFGPKFRIDGTALARLRIRRLT
ncbi:hypothetical protein [Hasllibacter sp. MH4015]|uniref:hypothetical protein n=1 Tax=Hasllibacter sp. MH4015 TaxID=2854029 RepID=UPI001CD764E0|nr:hypothetical protein [Hasllibacter sp. MH4015]